MKKLVAVFAMLMALLGLTAVLAPAASATQNSDTKTVVWEMPSWSNDHTATWPQKYVNSATNVGLNIEVAAECGYFQVDVYKYDTKSNKAKVDDLIKGGVLTGPSQPLPEPLISGGLGTAWKFVNLGTCETETPTPTPTETTETPTPTPTETTETPTPTPTETTPTPTPTETSSTPTPTATTSSSTPVPTGSEKGGPPDELAKTGSVTPGLVGLGTLLALGGAGLLALTRRKGSHV